MFLEQETWSLSKDGVRESFIRNNQETGLNSSISVLYCYILSWLSGVCADCLERLPTITNILLQSKPPVICSYWDFFATLPSRCCLVAKFCNSLDYSLPGSSVSGILECFKGEKSVIQISLVLNISSPGDFPDQESYLCLLHWQVDSLPLSHQGSPCLVIQACKSTPVVSL